MRPLILAGLALILAGMSGLVLEHGIVHLPQKIAAAGSIEITARTASFFPVSTIAEIFAVVAGIALLYFGRRAPGP